MPVTSWTGAAVFPGAGGATYGCIGALGHVVADAKGITLGYGRVDVWPEACQGSCDSNSGRQSQRSRHGANGQSCGPLCGPIGPARSRTAGNSLREKLPLLLAPVAGAVVGSPL